MTSALKRIRIKDIGKVITGTTPPTQNHEYYGSDFLFIKPSDITPALRRVFSSETRLSLAGQDYLRGKELPRNTTCVVCIGTIGKLCLTNRLSFTNQQINSVLPNTSNFDPVYVFYLLSTTIPKLQKLQGGSASGREHVNKTNFENIGVEVHSLPTQHKIAGVLSAYDDLIENNTRRIAILEEMAQTIYREWFVNFRFPGHEKVKLINSPLGKIPEGWAATVADFGRVVTGKTPTKTKPENFGGDIPFVKTPDMHGHLFCISTSETLSESGMASQPSQTVPPNSVCISCIGTVGAISITTTACQTNQQINTIIPHSPYLREFIVLCLHDSVARLKQMGAAGATMDNVSKGKLMAFDVLLPPSDVLVVFSSVTSELFDQIKLLQKHTNVLRTTRDLLLPKLISGQLDVDELEIETGEPLVEAEAG